MRMFCLLVAVAVEELVFLPVAVEELADTFMSKTLTYPLVHLA